jgi:aminoglycoside/choline kinase family phosphotransferase
MLRRRPDHWSESMTEAVPVPRSLDEVTAAWLEAALGTRFPGVRVASCEVSAVIGGSATKLQLSVTYDEQPSEPLPPSFYAKTALEDHGMAIVPGNAQEIGFYAGVAPEVPVQVPRFYYGEVADDLSQSILLLEDLTLADVTFCRATSALSVDQAVAVVEQLAALHALWWANEDKLPTAQFTDAHIAADALAQTLLAPAHWEMSLGGEQGRHVPEALQDRQAVVDMVYKLWHLDAELPQCLNHGDAHLGNLYVTRDGRPGFLDWQTLRRGPWQQDLTYFLVGALEPADRRSSEQEVLRTYLAALAAAGAPAPSFDEAWLDYRRHVLHGFLWVVCPVEMQPIDVISANVERFATAACDLDTMGALAALA